MTKQQMLVIEKDNGWVTRIVYRKSMDDFVITQKHEGDSSHNGNRYIYLFGKDVRKKLVDFVKHLDIKTKR